jgi:hypothetical protein
MPFKAIAAKLAPKVLPGVGKVASGLVKTAGATVGKPLGGLIRRNPPPIPGIGGGATTGPGGGPIVNRSAGRSTTAQAVAQARAMGGAGAVAPGGIMKGVIDTAGRWWTNSKIASLVRRVGPEAAALALGLAVTQVYQAVAENHAKGSRRRRKGLSYRDINTTRRTLSRLDRLACLARKPMTTRKKTCR